MRMTLAIAAATLLACAAPAFAQSAGAPGAVGTGGSLTGSNPGTGYGWNGPIGDSINPGPGPSQAYPDSPGNGNRGYLNEGRAAAPDYGYGGPGYGPGYGGPGYGQGNGGPGYGPGYGGPGYGQGNGGPGYAGPGYGGQNNGW